MNFNPFWWYCHFIMAIPQMDPVAAFATGFGAAVFSIVIWRMFAPKR